MRNLLLTVASVLSLLVALGFLSTYNARVHAPTAEEFLRLIGENKPKDAFEATTSGFRRSFPWESFNRFVTRFHLANYRPGSFRLASGRTSYTNSLGLSISLVGDSALLDGTHFQTTIRLGREDGRWKVSYVYVKFLTGHFPPASPVSPTPTATPLGTDAAFKPQPFTLRQKPASSSKESPLFSPKPPETHTDRRNVFPSSSPTTVAPSPTASPP